MDIFTKYDNLPADYVPNNEWRFAPPKPFDVVIPGGTCVHACEFSFWFKDHCTDLRAIYTQGTCTKAELQCDLSEVEELEDLWGNQKSIVRVTLPPWITSRFDYYNQDTYWQLKMTSEDGVVSYGPKILIKVIRTLDHMGRQEE